MYEYSILILSLTNILLGCNLNSETDGPTDPSEPDITAFQNASSNLPLNSLSGNSMDAKTADLDNDGDRDLIVAVEFGPNKLLINNGDGIFNDQSSGRLPARDFDSEEVVIAEFNGDGLLDLFFVSEDNLTNEFYLNGGEASFFDATNRIPVSGTSNAVETADIDNDGDMDLLIGNNGQNAMLINNGNAFFFNQTNQRLPERLDITQDVEFGDIDGDGDLDILVGNEDENRILINSGTGFFTDQTSSRLPLTDGIEETREVDLGDIDGDGDLDIYFSNVELFQSGANPQDRLLINDGEGVFSDSTDSQLPQKTTNTMDADFLDIDGDGSLDLLVGNFNGGARLFINDGTGNYTDETEEWLPDDFSPRVMDFEASDYNGDQLTDIFIANFQSRDNLLLRRN